MFERLVCSGPCLIQAIVPQKFKYLRQKFPPALCEKASRREKNVQTLIIYLELLSIDGM